MPYKVVGCGLCRPFGVLALAGCSAGPERPKDKYLPGAPRLTSRAADTRSGRPLLMLSVLIQFRGRAFLELARAYLESETRDRTHFGELQQVPRSRSSKPRRKTWNWLLLLITGREFDKKKRPERF